MYTSPGLNHIKKIYNTTNKAKHKAGTKQFFTLKASCSLIELLMGRCERIKRIKTKRTGELNERYFSSYKINI